MNGRFMSEINHMKYASKTLRNAWAKIRHCKGTVFWNWSESQIRFFFFLAFPRSKKCLRSHQSKNLRSVYRKFFFFSSTNDENKFTHKEKWEGGGLNFSKGKFLAGNIKYVIIKISTRLCFYFIASCIQHRYQVVLFSVKWGDFLKKIAFTRKLT